MRIAIVTEKPFVARTLAPLAQELFPGAQLDHLVCWSMGLYRPALPRGLAWRDYPHIAPFQWKDFRFNAPRGPLVGRLDDKGYLGLEESLSVFDESLRRANRLVAVLDPSPDVYHFDVSRRMALGSGIKPGEVRMPMAWDDQSLRAALMGQREEEAMAASKFVGQGQVLRYFDYQFAINSLTILSRTAGHSGWISKYQLQTLYLLADHPGLTEGEIISMMAQGSGTGRYPQAHGVGLGSPISRVPIIEQIVGHGWLERTAGHRLRVSQEGHRMLQRLHPGCRDPDLPFRLRHWASRGLSESQPAIDRYIRTFFGRQKRFIERAGRD